jgi:hypothetical protein
MRYLNFELPVALSYTSVLDNVRHLGFAAPLRFKK